MSGSIGANRIPRSAVENTLKAYIEKVLNNFPGFKSAKISGSYNTSVKPDHGDLDLVINIEGDETDKKILKQKFASFLNSLPDNIIPPFKAGRHIGKKSAGTGDIVITQFPIEGYPDLNVQIDNMVVMSEVESDYRKSFLDLPAEKQGLLVGLAKAVLLEEIPTEIFNRLGIKNVPKLEANQELEFNLSNKGLTLRLVTLGDNFKEINRSEIWTSFNWGDVLKLFKNYKLDGNWEDLLNDIKNKLTNPRSKNRIKGVFNSLVVINPGEQNTPKGDDKQKAKETVAQSLSEVTSLGQYITDIILENDPKTIALFPGAFKPPHKSHFELAQRLSKVSDEVIIVISPIAREGITAEQSLDIWNLYIQNLPNIKAIISTVPSPVRYVYEMIEFNPTINFVVTFGKGEGERYKTLSNKAKYPNAKIYDGGTIEDLSATELRNIINSLTQNNISKFLPSGVNIEDFNNILNINPPQEDITEEIENYEIKYWALYADIYDSLKTNPDKSYNKLKHELTGEKLKALDYFYSCYFSPDVKINESLQETWKPEESFISLCQHMINNGMNIKPLPKIKIINNDEKNASDLLGKTAYYNPTDKSITLYTMNRHPKDILRSFSHEMIHHEQNLDGRLNNINTTNTNEDGALPEIEKEAYEKGNMMLRNWEDSIKAEKYIKEYKEYVLNELFEKDLPNIEKLNSYEYKVGDGKDIEALYYFRQASLDPNDFEIHWKFTGNNKNTSLEAWKQITATSFKIIKHFVDDKNPRYIEISGDTDEKTKMYKSKSYLERLENILNNQYKIDNSNQYVVYLKKIEEVCKSAIKKRMETLNESYEQSLDYWQNGDTNSKSKIERWDASKRKIKREVLQEIYNLNPIYDIPLNLTNQEHWKKIYHIF